MLGIEPIGWRNSRTLQMYLLDPHSALKADFSDKDRCEALIDRTKFA